MRNRDGNVIDKGFNNIGVRPTDDDLGVGASDAFGPLSFTRAPVPDARRPGHVRRRGRDEGLRRRRRVQGPVAPQRRADGARTSTTATSRTLREVVELYSRGGNVAPITALDGTLIEPLGVPVLTSDEIDAHRRIPGVAHRRARFCYRRAPFDHPQIFVPNGHPGDSSPTIDADRDGRADDVMIEIPAVGAAGGAPLPGFLEGVFGSSP